MFLPLRDHNPTARFPWITAGLIVLNVLMFLREIAAGPEMPLLLARWGATPYELTQFEDLIGRVRGTPLVHVEGPPVLWLTALTSMFLHGGWLHLLLNMHFLWIFGNNVEDALGSLRFLAFYLATGLLGLGAHVLTDPLSIVPTVGASGAISGMLGAYLVLYPRARVQTLLVLGFFVTLLEVRAVLLILVWTVIQVFGGLAGLMASGVSGGVAYWAHIGGFVAGFAGMRMLFPGTVARARAAGAWRRMPEPGPPPPPDDRWRGPHDPL